MVPTISPIILTALNSHGNSSSLVATAASVTYRPISMSGLVTRKSFEEVGPVLHLGIFINSHKKFELD